MKIGMLAKAADVSKDTIRHYVNLGLLVANKNSDNGYQEFSQTMLNRLRFIKAAQSLGFKLEEIAVIFHSAEQLQSPCGNVRDIVQRRIEETRRRIVDLNLLCERMQQALTAWERMPNGVPNGQSVCHLIESRLTADQQHKPQP